MTTSTDLEAFGVFSVGIVIMVVIGFDFCQCYGDGDGFGNGEGCGDGGGRLVFWAEKSGDGGNVLSAVGGSNALNV
jgi:hypothetical protein